MKTKYVKETDNKGRTFIVEGEEKQDKVFSIKRFICEVQKQETEKETQEVAHLLLKALLNLPPAPANCEHPYVERVIDQDGHEYCGKCYTQFEN